MWVQLQRTGVYCEHSLEWWKGSSLRCHHIKSSIKPYSYTSMPKQEIICCNPTAKGLILKKNKELVDMLKEINISNLIAVDYII